MLTLSDVFDIEKTSYGGRGCFAKEEIKQGTTVLLCEKPYSSSILRSFKKEVCTWCFRYENGSNLKFKIPGLNHFYFCSDKCIKEFQFYDVDGLYSSCIVHAEEEYVKAQKRKNQVAADTTDIKITVDVIQKYWDEVKKWEMKLPIKVHKRSNLIPYLDENELMELKYAIGCLFEMKREEDLGLEQQSELDLNSTAFKLLQSDEILKLSLYPYLLESYTRVYKFLKLTLAEPLQKYLTTNLFRDIIGKNLSNAFGIWELSDSDTTNKEFFGYSVYPTASFFNHSCAPNLARKRVGRAIHFMTSRDILPGEELCICYGNAADEEFEIRQKELDEWHFKCQCTKCKLEQPLENMETLVI
ncbi:hypothetical protein CLIB1423_07S04830 [[Candida] railenensis]|uniref:SET domain-containing protein n=1 Tax=[Candida] railenensis TaxID=45579 RepID=A0A9P0QQN5_9ASCO|nr:hypothetical protein CLIB1423_07S04830 [[Candida] railenensis]